MIIKTLKTVKKDNVTYIKEIDAYSRRLYKLLRKIEKDLEEVSGTKKY